ncbi:uncharacterized protein YvpB [Pullulanibacillus pueri]|uniref:Peptidase C39-like domain-containing protein n=1 Tax=Pullulanibacillus pueri TaxID=1437324 RepID=A0A8J3A0D7_9BACL|nr:C39 family peptidase [Pullulanibacillus pueri]MBM7683746.1 uncharacterized protein YvpB [Pullulanibacillus pueri]GGH87365.1 hypothetical protein GCM10007096_37220 [Pullulanibacillus pueri]
MIHTKLIDVPLISQLPELPRGCEVTSLAMLLSHAGLHVEKERLAEEIIKVPFEENGLRGHPNDGFVGDMYSFETPGLGTFHSPIASLAQHYLGNQVVDLTGCAWERIEECIDKGTPVWVIVTSRYRFLEDEFWETWETAHGKLSITYKEHAVVLTGYDHDTVYFNDPLDNIKNRPVNKNDFIAGWKQFGHQAIIYQKA